MQEADTLQAETVIAALGEKLMFRVQEISKVRVLRGAPVVS